MHIAIDQVTVIRDGQETREFKAVFRFSDLEEIAKELILARLQEMGQIDNSENSQIRIESRYCEPDGDMGWPGTLVKIDLMIGAANYYPKLMEGETYDTTSKTAISSIDIPAIKSLPLWRRLLNLISNNK